MASRHRSRELAVQLAYQWELDPASLSDPRVLARFWKEQAMASDDNRAFFEFLVKGVADYLPQIDRVIEEMLKNWRMGRVEKVDLAVLRVGAFELLYGREKSAARGEAGRDETTDTAVVINEAVELAKKFGNKGSPAFVNGILDAMTRRDPKTKVAEKAGKAE